MHFSRLALFSAAITLAVITFGAAPTRAALVTFSGLNNGINTPTDPDNTSTGTLIPSGYQPLLNSYSAPGGNTDGANIGVTITWGNVYVANSSFPGVFDHTNMVTPSDTAEELGYDNGNTMDIQFDKAVSIPSFYYANYSGGGPFSIEFKGYTNVGDATPVVDIIRTYTQTTGPNGGGYQWIQETGLGTTPIKALVISGDNYKQTDDYTINLAPEPASLGLVGFGALGVLIRRRRV